MDQQLHVLRLISESTRFHIIQTLLQSSEENLCVNDIAEIVGVSPSAVSHHFAKLEIAGIVRSYKIGRKVCYKIATKKIESKLFNIITILQS